MSNIKLSPRTTAALLAVIFLSVVIVVLLMIGTQQAQAQAVTPHNEYAIFFSPGKGVGPGAHSTPYKGYHMTITDFGNNKPTKARVDAIRQAWISAKGPSINMATAKGHFEPVSGNGYAFKLYPDSSASKILNKFSDGLKSANMFQYVHHGNWHVTLYDYDSRNAQKTWDHIKTKNWHIYVVTKHIDKNGHATITNWDKII